MQRRTSGLTVTFMLLLIVTAIGILVHYLTGYHYPASPAADFEINVLGDPFELFFIIPVGLVAIWALKKDRAWGTLLVAGVASHFVYNYAMFVTGRQNLWVFVWILKLVLSGVVVGQVWHLLPAAYSHRSKQGIGVAAYLAIVLLVFSKLMAERLIASATGQAVDMTMQGAGVIDWGEPFLRDPIVFFTLACPIAVMAIIGLLRGTDWGARAAGLFSTFVVSIVTVVLFTGPLKEYLQVGAVSSAMWGMSLIMVIAAAPAVWAMAWLVKCESKTH